MRRRERHGEARNDPNGAYTSASGSGGVSPIEPANPPGFGFRGSRTPAEPNPSGKSPQPKLSDRRVRQTLQR
jgi:hypothetical protein